MKGKEKQISIFLILFLFLVGIIFGISQKNKYQFPIVKEPTKYQTSDLTNKEIKTEDDFDSRLNNIVGRTNYSDKKLIVDENFTSNLPLIVIDSNGKTPKRGVVWDGEKDYYVSTGEDPYVTSKISVINNENGLNKLSNEVTNEYLSKIKIRGNSSGNYDKKQYLIKLIDESGKKESKDFLNMGRADEWILNVSFIDKSLFRNYLAYTTAGEFMPYTPDVEFCEVIWKDGDEYQYEGVYLLMESVSVGKYRVNLPKYSENSGKIPALIRRDRYNVNGIMLDNYATQKGLTSGYLDVEYPDKKDITKKGIDHITEQINQFEKALYADTWEEFIKYRDFVDIKSFIDYFLVNEFFMNYDAGYNSTYLYMNYSGKISMGPVWDFDQAMDNNETVAANLETTAFHSAPWFDKILQDPAFTEALIERFSELRKSILSDSAIRNFINDTTKYLGSAIDRDWARWGYYYKNGKYLTSEVGIERNTTSHQEEVEKILSVLQKHAAWMDDHLDSLYQFKMISLEEAQALEKNNTKDYRPLLAVTFVIIFLISINIVLKYESE